MVTVILGLVVHPACVHTMLSKEYVVYGDRSVNVIIIFQIKIRKSTKK